MGSTRRYTKTLYLRVRPELHAAVLGYCGLHGWSVTGLAEHLLREVVLHDVEAAPRLRQLESRIDALEHRHA